MTPARIVCLQMLASLILSLGDTYSEPRCYASEELIPLAIGNAWVYKISQLNSKGEPTKVATLKGTIIGAFHFHGSVFYCQEYRVESDISNIWLANTKEGVKDVGVSWDEDIYRPVSPVKPTLLFKFPARLGEEYTTFVDHTEKPLMKARVASLDETIQVPAGKFRCITYQIIDISTGKIVTTYCVAPATGIVRETQYDRESGLPNLRQELSSKTLASTIRK